ncbi:CgeB family protein [Paenibacillus sp. UNC451MF]|uniref:CgeB family protein n=1 Tax=Paenibacillus sp. UNC451MF TaxID=1449063 RepID=UPI00068F0CD1|nr:glycosyltransferase [Paenibacillus sp. UNC451MF]
MAVHVKKSRALALRQSAIKGRKDGYRLGRSHGYHHGRCQAVLDIVPPWQPVKRALKVMYVEEGTPGFRTLDLGIAHSLGELVQEVLVVQSTSDLTDIAQQFKPDLVFILNGIFRVSNEQVVKLRQHGFRTAIWFMDDPYFTDVTAQMAPLYDYIFTHELNAVPFYKTLGCNHVYYLPSGVDRAVVAPRFVERSYRSDVCFIGSGFPNRLSFFNKVIPALKGVHLFMAGHGWNQLGQYKAIKKHVKLQGVLYDENIRHYIGAKIVINLHRSPLERLNSRGIQAMSINPRTFEICASGALQITDVRQDLSRYYTPGQELVTFASPEELVDRIHYYLRNEEERRRIALNGLYKTMSQHTYSQRLNGMLHTIFDETGG